MDRVLADLQTEAAIPSDKPDDVIPDKRGVNTTAAEFVLSTATFVLITTWVKLPGTLPPVV